MKFWADWFDGLVRAVGPGAIGEKGDGELTVGVNPEGCSGIAEVAVGIGAEIFSGLRRGGGSVPAEGAGSGEGRGFAAGEECDGFGAKDGAATVEHGVSVGCEVLGSREEAGVSCEAAEDESVFVLDLALDDAVAEGAAGFLADA